MSFNEMNTIENALRDHLCGRVKGEEGRVKGWENEVREPTVPYGSPFTPHSSHFHWQPQDVFENNTFININRCEVDHV